jgi:hypothetical protein
MHDGHLLHDGPTREVFADLVHLGQARLAPPPVTQLAQALAPQVFMDTPLTVDEFYAAYKQPPRQATR